MIILSETTDNLQAVLGGAVTTNQLQCVVSWRDRTSTTFVAGRTVSVTNDTTDVTIAAAPAASTQRIIDFISVYNADTANATVIIKIDANSTEYILFRTTLGPAEMLQYYEGSGFKVITNSGAIKSSINQGNNAISSSLNVSVLGSDVTNNYAVANTIADVTGLSFSVTSGGTYYFKFYIWYTADATTTGSRWSINGPANTALMFQVNTSLISTVNSTDAISVSNATAYDNPATTNTSSPNNSATGGQLATIEGFIIPSANGTVIARFSSEVANSAIVAKAGSFVEYLQVL